MIEQRLPVLSRWVLCALGATEARQARRPLDPVAGWLMKHHSFLQPSIPQPALLLTIRARFELVDRMLDDELHLAKQRGQNLSVWSFGSGFDGRWWRYGPRVCPTVRSWREVEAPALLELKHRLLSNSPFSESWATVTQKALTEDQWTTAERGFFRSLPTLTGGWRRTGDRPLVIFEAGPHRVTDAELRAFLVRLRGDAPEATVICGLPTPDMTDTVWRSRSLAELGWRVDEDVVHATRGRLMGKTGNEIVTGMYGFRVARLVAREPVQPR
jgi:hypothetical protein